MPEGNSFLPRIESVFYAVFDIRQGAKIVYQVPEGLIAVSGAAPSSSTNGGSSMPPTPSSDTLSFPLPSITSPVRSGLASRNSSCSLVSPKDSLRPSGGRNLGSSPQKRSSSSQRTLFNFNDISMYVIPPSPLCGRLVTCSTYRYRIIGHPVVLKGGRYMRNYFRYNLCFVFDREADLSCYEPIVRKVSHILKGCEEESELLSSPKSSPAIHVILEQLYEDLNSYSETSIQIDQFNSIELKILPFYPNPPEVKDWMVPLPVINLSKRVEENWDLTMIKVCKHVDGVNHVSRIARLADCDISLTRQAISHLLYFQVIMIIDIFQYSNMYSLRKNIQWLADEAHVREECGPYVTKPGRRILDWPKLLHLYSRFKPGKTVFDWMKTYEVEDLGIDVRRFTSFGVVKGFLRRVHRFPVYMPPDPSQSISSQLLYQSDNPFANSELARKRGKSQAITGLRLSVYNQPLQLDPTTSQTAVAFPTLAPEIISHGTIDTPIPTSSSSAMSATHRARRASAAEKVLEQLRSRDMQKSASTVLSTPRTSWLNFQQHDSLPVSATTTTTAVATTTATSSLSAISASVSSTTTITPPTMQQETPTKPRRLSTTTPVVPPPSPVLSKATLAPSRHNRPSRSSSMSAPIGSTIPGLLPTSQAAIPPGLIPLLDGDHHTDELSVKFETGWPLLEQWLMTIGGGDGNGDYGRVVIIYR